MRTGTEHGLVGWRDIGYRGKNLRKLAAGLNCHGHSLAY